MPNALPSNDASKLSKDESGSIPPSVCDALFSEILNNDELDPVAELPDRINLDYSQAQLQRCFDLSHALWSKRLDRAELMLLANTLYRTGDIGAKDALIFKHARARFKHLRFAFAVFGAGHRYPISLDAITSVMGNLQDAFKNKKPASVRRNALLFRLLLGSLPFSLMIREAGRFRPSTSQSFAIFMKNQAAIIARFLGKGAISAKEFHDTRKIISRYRAGYATIVTLDPCAEHKKIAAFIATINGLMGNYHDTLMSKKLDGTMDYHKDKFLLQDETRIRLQKLVSSMA